MKKNATKKTAPPAPIRIAGITDGAFHYDDLAALLGLCTSKELAALLRERGIGIPKEKVEMIDRLILWIRRDGGKFTLSLA